ncbi:MAG: tRNA (adenosine(37)-N6)-dimethylallyltransferase MiaA [Christensenellaceae bacterium]|nr:tRNA (adenosine(37)-N6)-dimethylallyltransferase MiaA [Christensenellaceae bacterium]
MMNKVIIIAGPTASGKTSLAVALAKRIDGEVVSADSMQIYRGMSIGTALPTAEEKQGVPHHLLEIVDPDEKFSAAVYQKRAFAAIDDILLRGKTPIVAGGTGLYINSITYDLDFTETSENTELRQQLSDQYDADPRALYAELIAKDPDCAQRIHENDKLRVIRRLEILAQGDAGGYDFQKENTKYDFLMFALTRDRAELYNDINRRVDIMRETGLTEEVDSVYKKYGGDITAFSAIGYKEFLPYFNGECDLESAYETIKRNTRRFAKRQLTWFRRDQRINWINTDDFSDKESIVDYIINNYWSSF